MKKKLIAAIVVALILLACAIGVVVFMENKPAGNEAGETTADPAVETTPASEDETTEEPTEETVGIALPTEDPNEVSPEVTFDPEDTTPPVTVDPDATQDPNATEDPDENAMPEMDF